MPGGQDAKVAGGLLLHGRPTQGRTATVARHTLPKARAMNEALRRTLYGAPQTSARLIAEFRENVQRIRAASSWDEHVIMSDAIMSSETSGVVVECGCYHGASSANLSLACAEAGRTLYLCDTFSGLPAPDESDTRHVSPLTGRIKHYHQGDYLGSLDRVRRNIKAFGHLESCEFLQGDFTDTLSSLPSRIVVAFMDVDLNRSRDACLRHLWPRLVDGGWLFSHEAQDLEFTSRFFDHTWWRQHLGVPAPGLIGAGTGLPLSERGSALGYIRKGDSS